MLDKKMRPKKIKDLIGNDHLKQVLKRVDEWPAAILLTGETGCGKTTIARIIAKMRKSETQELNISNTRGIDQARAIIEGVNSFSLRRSGKTIVLNECHEATRQFQDAMLETLEEPPDGVVFILCTTDPQKLLPAIKSRCVTYTLDKLKYNESKDLLRKACKKEGIDIPKKLIRGIILASNGIPRKLLLIIDAIKDAPLKTAKRLIRDFEYVDDAASAEVVELSRLLRKGAPFDEVMAVLRNVQEPPESIRRIVCNYMAKVLLGGKLDGGAACVLDVFADADTDIGLAGIVRAVTILKG